MAKTKTSNPVTQLSLPLHKKNTAAVLSKTNVVGLTQKQAEKKNRNETQLYKNILGRIKHLQD